MSPTSVGAGRERTGAAARALLPADASDPRRGVRGIPRGGHGTDRAVGESAGLAEIHLGGRRAKMSVGERKPGRRGCLGADCRLM